MTHRLSVSARSQIPVHDESRVDRYPTGVVFSWTGRRSRVPPGRKDTGGLIIPAMNRWASFACPSGTKSMARRLIAGKIVRPSHSPRPGGTREIGRAIHCGNPAASVCVVPEGHTMFAQRFIAGSPRCPLIASPGVPEGRETTAKASTKSLPPGVMITTRVNCLELTPSACCKCLPQVPAR